MGMVTAGYNQTVEGYNICKLRYKDGFEEQLQV